MSGKSNMGKEFEGKIMASFEAYEYDGRAWLARMPEPMQTVRNKGRVFNVRTGKAPFDFYGYTMDDATMIGAEAKCSQDFAANLSIAKPEAKSAGLAVKWHQLEALAKLHAAGGLAFVLWDNGGTFGRCGGNVIYRAYENCVAALESGKHPRGTWSISWRCFTPFDYGVIGRVAALDWLVSREDMAAMSQMHYIRARNKKAPLAFAGLNDDDDQD